MPSSGNSRAPKSLLGFPPSLGEPPPARWWGDNPRLGPPAPLVPLIPPARTLPSQQPRQAGDALTGSRWSPAEVSGAQQWNHIDHIAPFLFFAFDVRLEVSPLITSSLPPYPPLQHFSGEEPKPSPCPPSPSFISFPAKKPSASRGERRVPTISPL